MPQYKGLLGIINFLGVDPEIFPLIGLVSLMVGTAGYMAGNKSVMYDPIPEGKFRQAASLGRPHPVEIRNPHPHPVHDIQYPWQKPKPKPQDVWQCHIRSSPEPVKLPPPQALNAFRFKAKVPKELVKKLPELFIDTPRRSMAGRLPDLLFVKGKK